MRDDFRNFRLDRIVRSETETTPHPDEPERRLADYLRAMSCRDEVIHISERGDTAESGAAR